MLDTAPLLSPTRFPALKRWPLERVQVNLGYRCNQQCRHCHVNAGPNRTEMMSRETVDQLLAFMQVQKIRALDLTGGAPELNPHFRYLVTEARKLGVTVMDRCNLTVLEEPEQAGLAEFLAEQGGEIIASLPCYLSENVDAQRGRGVYEASIRGLKRLNALGYGDEASGLALNLVYNPAGASLPPPQKQLELDYKRELRLRHGVCFNRLFVLTNMPIQRFGSLLLSQGGFDAYLKLLHDAFDPANLAGLMCRDQISIDWRGYVYDCDFNQMLDMPLLLDGRGPVHLTELSGRDLANNPIRVAEHCYGCTAGQGSSCGGALSDS